MCVGLCRKRNTKSEKMSATLDCGNNDQFVSLSDESTRSCNDYQLKCDDASLVNDSGVECSEENKHGYASRSPYVYQQSNYYYPNSYQPYQLYNDNTYSTAPTFNQMQQQQPSYNYTNYEYTNYGGQMGYARSSPLGSDSFSRSSNGFLNSSLLSSSIDSGKSITPPPSSIPLSVQTESNSNSINNSSSAPKHSSPSLITTCASIQQSSTACQFQTDFTFNHHAYKNNFYDGYAPYKFNNNDSSLSFNQTSDVIKCRDDELDNDGEENEDDEEEDEQQQQLQQKDGESKKNGKQSPKKESPNHPTKKYKRRTRTTFTKTQVSHLLSDHNILIFY